MMTCPCGSAITLKYGTLCDPCRSQARRKRIKWVPTDAIDAYLRKAYTERLEKHGSPIPSLKAYAEKIHWPVMALKRRALVLGLTRTKEPPWSKAELTLLRPIAWMNDHVLARKFAEHGYHRTATAIHLKVRRERFKQDLPFYSAQSAAGCMGIDVHVVTRWVRLGYLKARRRETDRTAAQGGDIWLILEHDLRTFLLAHPTEWDIRKVEQLWFLDLITEGKVAA